MNIYGKTQLKIDGIGVVTVAVTDNSLKHELILGDDFLRQNKAIINYKDKSIQIKGKNFRLIKGIFDNVSEGFSE